VTRKRRLTRWRDRRVVVWLAVLLTALCSSCRAQRSRNPEGPPPPGLRYVPPLSRVELVEAGVDLAKFYTHPDPGIVPSGLVPHEYEIWQVRKGAAYWSVTAGTRSDERHSRAGVWLFHADWRPAGRVTKLPLEGGPVSIWAEWDRPGQELAVLVWSGGSPRESIVRLGLVTPARPDFAQILSLPGGSWPSFAWVDHSIVVAATRSGLDLVVLVNTTTREAHQLCAVRESLPQQTTISSLWPSPDGARVAFDLSDVAAYRPRNGLFLIEVSAGTCVQITYDDSAQTYTHTVVGWQGSDILLFARMVNGGRYDLYRAIVRRATAGTPR